MRPLKVRTLDGTNKTMMVDDSQNVANLMVVVCTKMGKKINFDGIQDRE
jgi:talin